MELRYAYGYVRVSTDKQEELSPDSQEKLLRDYAKSNNIILLEVFFEIGISGRKADKRPEFQRMISLAKSSGRCNPCLEIQPVCKESGRIDCLQVSAQKTA